MSKNSIIALLGITVVLMAFVIILKEIHDGGSTIRDEGSTPGPKGPVVDTPVAGTNNP